jgi:hypothetical protein
MREHVNSENKQNLTSLKASEERHEPSGYRKEQISNSFVRLNLALRTDIRVTIRLEGERTSSYSIGRCYHNVFVTVGDSDTAQAT